MGRTPWILIASAVVSVLMGAAAHAAAIPSPAAGLWGGTAAACRDPEGVDGLTVSALTFQWYETRCRAERVEGAGRGSWRLHLACEGEGRRFRMVTRLTLPTPNQMVMVDPPVGTTKLEHYVRCPDGRGLLPAR